MDYFFIFLSHPSHSFPSLFHFWNQKSVRQKDSKQVNKGHQLFTSPTAYTSQQGKRSNNALIFEIVVQPYWICLLEDAIDFQFVIICLWIHWSERENCINNYFLLEGITKLTAIKLLKCFLITIIHAIRFHSIMQVAIPS